ncbi:response regulator transcription factor [Streptomyces laculatispora]|uniref:Sensory transduction protein RegX3 n=1 Tax=Streptomyces laculatispora TaxID=887464 RepID=A0ABY9I0R1_9ACTN|nr:response regulator transcription factor [Streptomyces laculatispora]WLQ40106.1 response regulator transcription factor [Streptomyces laculatispora]
MGQISTSTMQHGKLKRLHVNPPIHQPRRATASQPAEQQREGVLAILAVGSEESATNELAQGLRRHGYRVESAATGARALHLHQNADLILLDLDLPDLDGLEVCRSIRASCQTPLIAVTARESELDRVLALQAGADDCMTKPYGFRELMARMEAVMRRTQPQWPLEQVIEHGPLRIDVNSREIRLGGRPIEVTRKEFDLLHLLASWPDTVIPRQQLAAQVWGESMPLRGRTIDTHVSSLRSKLGSSSWIVTVRGVGFRLGSQ